MRVLDIDCFPMAIAIYEFTDGEFIFKEFNKMAEITDGLSAKDLLGKSLNIMYPEVEKTGFLDTLAIVHKTGKDEVIDLIFYEDKRMSGWRRNTISKLENGYIMACYQDVTPEVSLKLYADKQKIKLDEFSQIISENVIYSQTDLEGNIIDVSDAFVTISGYPREELLGNTHAILRHPDMLNAIFSDLWKTITSGNTWTGNIKNLAKDGSSYCVDTTITPEYDSNKVHIGFTSVRLDITDKLELKRLNNNLEEMVEEKTQKLLNLNKGLEEEVSLKVAELSVLNKDLIESAKLAQIGEMMESITHQWRQPLSTISTTMLTLRVNAELETLNYDTVSRFSKIIEQQTNYLSETIETFRSYLNDKSISTTVHLQNELHNIVMIASHTLRELYIEYEEEYIQEPITLKMPKGELAQVLINLINNAKDILIENKVKNPLIKIKLKRKDHVVLICVEDNGGGIPKDILPKIFESHFTTKTSLNGTGIGLHMSRRIVEESLGGNLYVQNNESGASFFIELPTV